MKKLFLLPGLVFLIIISLHAQQGDSQRIRIADTLTAQEKNNHYRVILQSEVDSIIKIYNAANVPVKQPEPVKESMPQYFIYFLPAVVIALLMIGFVLYLLVKNQKRFRIVVSRLNAQLQYLEMMGGEMGNNIDKSRSVKIKSTAIGADKKIIELNAQLEKLKEKNNGLEQLLKEYNGIKQEYESIRQQISSGYKIKNYPGYDKTDPEAETLKKLLATEKSLATYAYENFFKSIIAIADANKNDPAGMSKDDREKLLELLVSLSLFYIEYLYLRINDLSFGGNMGERISSISEGAAIDPLLLKKLNKEHGSRALVLRMALDKTAIHQLSYPVFDETLLNNL